jgi:DNA-binding GntR family transcriptional regulator
VTADPRKYRRIYLALKQEISDGAISEGTQLHIGELSERFGASRDTVQSALGLLAEDKLAWRVPGLGWFVGQPGE